MVDTRGFSRRLIVRCCAVLIAICTGVCNAESILFSDYASNYGGTWLNGSNQGTGFGSWNLFTSFGASSAGTYLASSTADGFGDVNGFPPATTAFGMYGYSGYQNAERSLASPLAVGNSFSIDLAMAYRSGAKGISLFRNGNFSGGSEFWNFNVGGDKYTAGGVDQSWSYSQTSVFNLEVTQTSSTTVGITLTRGGDTYSTTISGISQLTGVRMYVGDTGTGGTTALNNYYFNNMVVTVPEPGAGTVAALGSASLALVSFCRARRQRGG